MISPLAFAGALLIEGAVFVSIIAWLLWAHNRERADLLARIMARDWGEYQAGANPPAPRRGPHNVLERQRAAREGSRPTTDDR